MLLRSSSTPVLGSLLTSFSDSPNNNHHRHLSESNTTIKHPPTTIHHIHNKPPLHQTVPLNLTSVSCNSSPQFSEHSYKGFRRAQSEGNLEGLAYASCNSNDKVHNSIQPQKFSGRPKCSMLQPIPSFSLHSSIGECEDEEAETDQEELNTEKLEENDEFFERSVDGEDKFMAMEGSEFNWDRKMNMGLVEEKGFKVEFGNMGYEKERELVSSGMYLARGLGVSGGGFGGGSGGGGNDFTPRDSGGDGGDGNRPGVEDYYRRMVEENPGNPLFLRNYAQFLYQSKQDLHGAEEYYSRAILADPKDGEILSQYAKLVWELHRDQDKASSYFERSAQAAPEDNHVLAAYASFLWETEEDEDEDSAQKDLDQVSPIFHKEALASASA